MTVKQIREEAFHDGWAATEKVESIDIRAAFEGEGSPENRIIREKIGDIRGKRILELGSGLGESAVYFATQGANVVASDISQGMLDFSKKLAARHGVKIETVKASATDLSILPASSFDYVYSANLLHHVDIAPTIREVHRVLKAGGVALFWDPIAYNPVINAYRRIATQVRTVDEHPLTVSDLRTIRSSFEETEVRFTWLFSLVIFLKYYLLDRLNPNRVRYWKHVVSNERQSRLLKLLHGLDRLLLKVPGVRWLAWNMVVIARKSNSDAQTESWADTA